MKSLLLLVILFLIGTSAFSQLKTSAQNQCPPFVVDLLDGKVNGVKPDVTQPEIKKLLPCFSSVEPEDNTSKCGGLVAFKDRDLYFYSGRNYIEIREKFKGKLSIPLMGAARNSLFKWLGNVKIRDTNWDAYQTSYGLIIVYFNKANKINKIQFSTDGPDSIKLCE
jgi:hypothetical protein